MAFLAKNFIFVGAIKSLQEINKSRYILTATKTGIFKNEVRINYFRFKFFKSLTDSINRANIFTLKKFLITLFPFFFIPCYRDYYQL